MHTFSLFTLSVDFTIILSFQSRLPTEWGETKIPDSKNMDQLSNVLVCTTMAYLSSELFCKIEVC